jgi:hypothetical protein
MLPAFSPAHIKDLHSDFISKAEKVSSQRHLHHQRKTHSVPQLKDRWIDLLDNDRNDYDTPIPQIESLGKKEGVVIDVLKWMNKCGLDIIGTGKPSLTAILTEPDRRSFFHSWI